MLKAVSLYSGIGGLDFGFEAAGFETRVALEFDKTACATMRLNREWAVVEDDVNNVSSEQLLEIGNMEVEEPDILFGGPPCQPFSKSSYWVRGDSLRLDDPRADTLTAYLRILRDLKPRTFLLENVTGIAFKNKDEGLKLILNGIDEINEKVGTNYKVSWKSVNCVRYGVPQRRERVFLVGSIDGREFQFPEETHAAEDEISTELFGGAKEPFRNAWDALHDLPEPNSLEGGLKIGGKWGDLLPSIPEGENYLWHTNRGGGQSLFGWRTRYWSFLLKLSKSLPSWTIQAQPGSSIGPFHWNNRRLTFHELCRLQTFPDGLKVDCGRTEMQRMVGNAVPSLMAEILARAIKEQLLDVPNEQELKLLQPRQPEVPMPEKVFPLEERYLAMIGEHDDHPGTGKGKRAVKQREAAQTTIV